MIFFAMYSLFNLMSLEKSFKLHVEIIYYYLIVGTDQLAQLQHRYSYEKSGVCTQGGQIGHKIVKSSGATMGLATR